MHHRTHCSHCITQHAAWDASFSFCKPTFTLLSWTLISSYFTASVSPTWHPVWSSWTPQNLVTSPFRKLEAHVRPWKYSTVHVPDELYDHILDMISDHMRFSLETESGRFQNWWELWAAKNHQFPGLEHSFAHSTAKPLPKHLWSLSYPT